jgi:hypothetical protein
MNEHILKLPELTSRQVRKLSEIPEMDDATALAAVRAHIPVMVWDDEDEDGVPFRASLGYAIGMKIDPANGALLVYAYTPHDGFRCFWKHAVQIPQFALPTLLFKQGEHYYVGKLARFFDIECTLACIDTDSGVRYEVPLGDIALCDSVRLGLEVEDDTDIQKAVSEDTNNEVSGV